jgi:nucleoside-diphosphate-sugar epimerase
MTAPAGGTLTVWGAGEEARDLLYVGDLVRCVELVVARQTAPFGLYNVGSGTALKVRDVVRQVIAATGRELSVEHDLSRPTIPFSLALDSGRIAAEIGWRPETTLAEGLARTIAYWKAAAAPADAAR